MDSSTISFLIAIIGCVVAIATFFVGRQAAAKNSANEWGAFTAELRTDVKYIKNDMAEIKAKIELIGDQQSKARTDIEINKRDLKTAFNRIDELRGK